MMNITPMTGPTVGGTVHLLGTLVTFRALGADTGGTFSLCEAVTAPGQGTPPHRQQDAEAFYVLDGSFEFILEDEVTTLGPGGFTYVAPGQAHGFRNAADTPSRMLIISLPGGPHEQFLFDAGEPNKDETTFPPMSPPDIPALLAVTARHGIEMLPMG